MGLALLVAGTLLIGFGLVAPLVLRVPNRLWWRVAQAVGWVNTRVLLTLFFAIVLTPVGVAILAYAFRRIRVEAAQPGEAPDAEA